MRVASLPVPAVVGTATNGVSGPVYGSCGPTFSRWSVTDVPVRSSPAIALAASRTLPPPIPRTTSIPSPRKRATASSTWPGEGSPETVRSSEVRPANSRASTSSVQRGLSRKESSPGHDQDASAMAGERCGQGGERAPSEVDPRQAPDGEGPERASV